MISRQNPFVSIITPSFHRPQKLKRAIASVQAQTWKDWEHIVVHDGPADDDTRHVCVAQPGLTLFELGRNWKGSQEGAYGAVPRNVGCYLARGQFIAYLDDDNEYLPHHLTHLLAALGQRQFAYSANQLYRQGKPCGTCPPIGYSAPACGAIDTSSILHRPELLRIAAWNPNQPAEDWTIVEAWMKARASWAFTGVVSVKYHFKEV
jgi:Glycosyl transferase family 2